MALNYLMRENRNSVFVNTNQDKDLILAHLKNKMDETALKSAAPIGQKNLIYFTVFKEESYLDLLEICLKSIAKYTPTPCLFDILFITQESFVEKIKAFGVLQNFNYDFHVTKNTNDGVQASMKKLKIFNYKNIDDYRNILFLDCDIICIKDMNMIFNYIYDTEYLQVASNGALTHNVWGHRGVFWNLDYMTQEQANFIEEQKPIPFNAGQFYFCNSERMKSHFENVLWLSQAWPGEYFFEQSFMNFYFTLNGLCKKTVINNLMRFINIGPVPNVNLNQPAEKIQPIGNWTIKDNKKIYRIKDPEAQKERVSMDLLGENDHIIHFIGLSLFGSSKKNFILNFLTKNNLCL